MVKTTRRSWMIGGWMATMAVLVAVSMALDANRSTTGLLIALGVSLGLVIVFMSSRAPSPSVAEILHAVDTNERRP
jgi:hypothetical protein